MLAPRLHRFNNLAYLDKMPVIAKKGTQVLKYQNPGFRVWLDTNSSQVTEEIYDSKSKKWSVLRLYPAKKHEIPTKTA